MGLQYVGSVVATMQRGIEADETGINTLGFSVRYFPQFKDKKVGFNGQVIGFCIPDKLSREVTITGDVIVGTTSGLMSANFAAAVTVANDITSFVAVSGGSNSGGLYIDEATIDQTAEGWRSLNMRLSSDPQLA